MRNIRFFLMASCALFLLIGGANAQQFDLTAGASGVTGPASTPALQTVGGGTFLNFGGDFLFAKHIGVGMEVAFRAKQNLYQSFQPFRPIFYDANAVYAPPLGKRAQAELQGGFGAESVRFYNPTFTCSFIGCTNFSSSNHILGHAGGGLRLYILPNVFIRPEGHVYFVRHNFEFTGARVTRFGVSIGYSLKNQE